MIETFSKPMKLEKLVVGEEVVIHNPPLRYSEKKRLQYTKNGSLVSRITKKTNKFITVDGFGKFRLSDGWAVSYIHNPKKPFCVESLEKKTNYFIY